MDDSDAAGGGVVVGVGSGDGGGGDWVPIAARSAISACNAVAHTLIATAAAGGSTINSRR